MVNVRLLVVGVVVIAIIIAGIAAFYLSSQQPQVQETIKIGFFSPITGPASADGLAALHGAELAVKHINSEGGIKIGGKTYKIELVTYDDQLNSDQVVAVSKKLIEQDKVVAAVSGSYSGPTLAASPIFEEKRVPLVVAYAVNPLITRDKAYIFRVGMLGETEGKAAGHIVVNSFNAKRVAIIYIDNPFGISLAENAKKMIESHGSQVVYMAKFQAGTQDFSPLLVAAKQNNPDALIIFGYYQDTVAVKQARELGMQIPIVGAEGFDSPKFLEIGGPAVENVVIITDLNRDSNSELVQRFIKEYKQTYGISADMVAASSYDAVRILVKAIELAQSTNPDDIVKALKSIKDYEGVTGLILGFTKGNNAIKYLTAQIVKNGEFRHFADIKDPDIITPSE